MKQWQKILAVFTASAGLGLLATASPLASAADAPKALVVKADAKDLILKAIRDDEYSRRLPAIREARRLALHEYATFPQIARIVTEHHKLPTADPASTETIISRHLWRKRHPVEAISQLVQKSALQLRQRLTQPVVQDNRPTI